MIAVTGATGQLGRLVIDALLGRVPAGDIVALVRDPAKAADLAAKGVTVRRADYDEPETLASALAGIGRLLLISGNAIGRRLPQHRAVIEAAKAAGVPFIAYTSVLRADSSALGVAVEHRATEELLAASGIAHALLRNGWYTENYTASVPVALQHGVLLGSAGEGRIASAARADYAEAAAAVLTAAELPAGKVYELAGDSAFTLAGFAAELSRQTGRAIPYNNLPEAEYRGILLHAGLPEGLADLIAQSDAAAAGGALFDDGGELGRLIGRPTTPLAASISAALATG